MIAGALFRNGPPLQCVRNRDVIFLYASRCHCICTFLFTMFPFQRQKALKKLSDTCGMPSKVLFRNSHKCKCTRSPETTKKKLNLTMSEDFSLCEKNPNQMTFVLAKEALNVRGAGRNAREIKVNRFTHVEDVVARNREINC